MDFLSWVDEQIPAGKPRNYAIMDNLNMHHCHDLLLFQIHHAPELITLCVESRHLTADPFVEEFEVLALHNDAAH